ncbi:hypothetical protein HN011_009230 [Eciton burchellii]|nr:hypothetical protein HN011_009230 [Eciton burchellii]
MARLTISLITLAIFCANVSLDCAVAEPLNCDRPNEEYQCGSACQTTCRTLGKLCPIINIILLRISRKTKNENLPHLERMDAIMQRIVPRLDLGSSCCKLWQIALSLFGKRVMPNIPERLVSR